MCHPQAVRSKSWWTTATKRRPTRIDHLETGGPSSRTHSEIGRSTANVAIDVLKAIFRHQKNQGVDVVVKAVREAYEARNV